MSEEKKTEQNNEKGIYPFGKLWWLIVLDFILFYFSFFKIEILKQIITTSWLKYLFDYEVFKIFLDKGITFTLFLFITFFIIYKRIPKTKKETK
ncbi:MAG: hypothetical protein Q7J16_11280 [Candidatus Cloacimonadales bacterium]|nr:hypothetical protein [Candidatus Cloacimonadales bacterium]